MTSDLEIIKGPRALPCRIPPATEPHYLFSHFKHIASDHSIPLIPNLKSWTSDALWKSKNAAQTFYNSVACNKIWSADFLATLVALVINSGIPKVSSIVVHQLSF